MITDPSLIEKTSFEIIESEITTAIPDEYKPLIYRIIHTTADFEYAQLAEIHPEAVKRGIAALKSGCRIYADTNMIQAGVNKKSLNGFQCEIYTLISDSDTMAEAASRGVTRSIVGMERACRRGDTSIFIIGNAPTALQVLNTEIVSGRVSPELVIGVPVGFVGASESKAALKESGAPYILTAGRKGGSTVAVAIINALLLMAQN
jgi:precorrin-8X/cobalt-precorrin-8 methylmutase